MTKQELNDKINDLCKKAGYQQAIVGMTRSGAVVPASDALLDGFAVTLILVKAKQDDADD